MEEYQKLVTAPCFQITTLYVGEHSKFPTPFIHIIRCLAWGCTFNKEFDPFGLQSLQDYPLSCVCGDDQHAMLKAWHHVRDHAELEQL